MNLIWIVLFFLTLIFIVQIYDLKKDKRKRKAYLEANYLFDKDGSWHCAHCGERLQEVGLLFIPTQKEKSEAETDLDEEETKILPNNLNSSNRSEVNYDDNDDFSGSA